MKSIFFILIFMFLLVGCSDRTLVLKDRLQNDTYYLDLRPNITHQKGTGEVSKLLNTTDETTNLTFNEEVRE